MSRRRHLLRLHHGMPRDPAYIRIIKSIGTGRPALPAFITGIDQAVGHVVAHDDGEIVIDLPDRRSGISFIMLQVDASFDALRTLALDASGGFRRGLLLCHMLRIQKTLRSFHPIHGYKEPALSVFFFRGCPRALQKAVGKKRRPLCGSQKPRDAFFFLSGEAVLLLTGQSRIRRNTYGIRFL